MALTHCPGRSRSTFLSAAVLVLATNGLPEVAKAALELVPASSTLVYQEGAGVRIELRATGRSAGLDPREIRLAATAGQLGRIRRAGNGFWFEWKAPARPRPMVVLIAAWAPGEVPAYCTVELKLVTRLQVTSDKPNVALTLSMGGRTYGPVRSDGRGRARISVEVGPSDLSANLVARDEYGNRSTKRIELPESRYPLMLGFAETGVLAADGQAEGRIWLVQLAANGRPLQKPRVNLKMPPSGRATTERLSDGIFVVKFRPPAGRPGQMVELEVADPRPRHKSSLKFTWRLVAGRPRSIVVKLDPQRFELGGKGGRILVELKDAAGNPAGSASPAVSCEAGRVEKLRAVGDGRFEAELAPPADRIGRFCCTVAVEVAGGEPLRRQACFETFRPPVGRLDAEASSYRLVADGRESTVIRLVAATEDGRPLSGAEIKVRAPLGSLSAVTDDGHGRYHVVYTAPRLDSSTRVKLFFKAGDSPAARAELTLELEAPPPPPVPVARWWAGVRAGVQTNLGALLGYTVALETGVRPFAWKWLFLVAAADYSSARKGFDGNELVVDGGRIEIMPVVRFLPSRRLSPWLGGGAAVQFSRHRLRHEQGFVEEDRRILPAAVAAGGLDIALGNVSLFVTVRYTWARLRAWAESPGGGKGSLVSGNPAGLSAGAGVKLFFY